MGQPHRLNITLSEEAIKFLRSKVSSGEYDSESEVINEGLRPKPNWKRLEDYLGENGLVSWRVYRRG